MRSRGDPPAPPVVVRRIRPNESSSLRSLRLAALRSDPTAFGSTLAREEGYHEGEWSDRARDGAEGARAATFVAEDAPDRWVGMAGVFERAGTFHVWGMWVEPGWRGRGVGSALLDRTIAWVSEVDPGAALALEVNPDQAAAVRLYRARGFRGTGTTRPLGHHAPATVEEMVRIPDP